MSEPIDRVDPPVETVDEKRPDALQSADVEVSLDALPKSRWERSWPVIACGAGLFSDGYLNGVSWVLFLKKIK